MFLFISRNLKGKEQFSLHLFVENITCITFRMTYIGFWMFKKMFTRYRISFFVLFWSKEHLVRMVLYVIPFWIPPFYRSRLLFFFFCSLVRLFVYLFVCCASILRPLIYFSIHFGRMPVLFVSRFSKKERKKRSNDWDNTRTQHCCI